MVGADTKAVFDDAAAVLRLMGKNIVHCGSVGNGQVAKLCNNMMLGISMVGVSEAMNLGVKCVRCTLRRTAHTTQAGHRPQDSCWHLEHQLRPLLGQRHVQPVPGRHGGFACV